ncbi:MAG: glycosyltransferase [Lachnospiraceae bacterium]|jgi:glycosyltransferase involved in cell wall biosynthesis|nr:glycosyltransferase [Lachnospiraceae bacterium]
MPLFSIITTVYNNERYVKFAIDSVLTQSFEDFEYIIIDDGSTDSTGEIIDKIASEDKRVKIIHQKNQWIFESLNNGLKLAKGEYIFVVNSDDRLRPEVLKIASQKIKLYKQPDIVWTQVLMHKVDECQNIILYDCKNKEQYFKHDQYFKNKKEVRNNWIMFYETGLASNQINFYKREIIKNYRFRNDIYGADLLFNISIASDINTALIMKEAAYDFFEYDKGNMNTSIGTYHGYEHDMFNDFFIQYKTLFEKWNLYNNEIESKLSKYRLKWFTHEIRVLTYKNCTLTIEEKLIRIFTKMIDEIVLLSVEKLKAQEELESRTLSGIRELLVKETLLESSEMYFVYELLDSLLRYEKDEDDFEKIKNAINHPLNPLHIGKIFYEKLVCNYLDGK